MYNHYSKGSYILAVQSESYVSPSLKEKVRVMPLTIDDFNQAVES